MFIVAALLILLILPIILFGINLSRPRYGFSWLISAFGGFIVWLLVLVSRLFLPMVLTPVSDGNRVQSLYSLLLLEDYASWSVAMALSSLVLAYILTDPARILSDSSQEFGWQHWPHGLVLTGFGILAAISGNIYTLLIAWAAFDLYEFLLYLFSESNKTGNYRLLLAYAIRISSLFVLIIVGIYLFLSFESTDLTLFDRSTSLLLLLAAGIRFFSIAIYSFNSFKIDTSGLGTQISLISASTSLIVLIRIAISNEITSVFWLTPVMFGLFAVYCALIWMITKNEVSRRIHWILALSTLALLASFSGQYTASLAWGLALLLAGGLIFDYQLKHRVLRFLLLVGALSLTALPFTPTWNTIFLTSGTVNSGMPVIGIITVILAQSLLLAGYIKQSLILNDTQTTTERWAWIIYPLGLVILIVSFFMIIWWGDPGIEAGLQAFPPIIISWAGIIITLLALVILFLFRDQKGRVSNFVDHKLSNFSIDRSYPFLISVYRFFESLVDSLDRLFEGEGGLLWTVLFLILLIALLFQFRTGI